MSRFLKILSSVWACGALLYGCGDEDLIKFGNINGVKNWKPDVVLPLAEGNFTLWDLIDQDEDKIVKENNEIIIRHIQKDIYSLKVEEVIEVPQEIASFSTTVDLPFIPVIENTQVLDFEPDPVSLNFQEGEIRKMNGYAEIQYTLPQTSIAYTAKVIFPDIQQGGVPVELQAAGGSEGTLVLEDILFDMTDSPNQLRWKIEITLEGGQPIPAMELPFVFKINNLVFTRVEGKVDQKILEIPEDKFTMDIDFWENFDGSFHFQDPRVSLIVKNYGLAVPVRMDMDFVAYGNGKSLRLETKNGYMPEFKGWIPDEGTREEVQGYSPENSNIAELLSLPPKDAVKYRGQAIINPEAADVVLLGDGRVHMDALVEIPLYLSAENLLFNIDVEDVNLKDADKILEAGLVVEGTNHIPVELTSGYLYMLDDNKIEIDSVKINEDGSQNFLNAPEVDAEGEVVKAAQSKCHIPLSEENIRHLQDTRNFAISVKARTSNGGKVPLRLKADATLKLVIRVEAKLNLDKL